MYTKFKDKLYFIYLFFKPSKYFLLYYFIIVIMIISMLLLLLLFQFQYYYCFNGYAFTIISMTYDSIILQAYLLRKSTIIVYSLEILKYNLYL